MAKFDYNDDSVVVIIGSGAGGGTLANELCQKGVKVVVLEAGKRQSSATFINDEWKSFGQLAWLDKRTTSGTWRVAKDFPELPAWICKTVGGTTTHWAGASLRLQEHEFKARTHLRRDRRRQSARLADYAGGSRTVLRARRRQDGRDAHQRHSGAARQQQLQDHVQRRDARSATRTAHRPHGDQQPAARRPWPLHAARLLLPGLQVRREMVDALHRDSRRRGNRQTRPAAPSRT